MKLGFSLTFNDLYSRQGLVKLDEQFIAWIMSSDLDLGNILYQARNNKNPLSSENLINLSLILQEFLSELFDLTSLVQSYQEEKLKFAELYKFKRNFVQRGAIIKHNASFCNMDNFFRTEQQLLQWIPDLKNSDFAFVKACTLWLEELEEHHKTEAIIRHCEQNESIALNNNKSQLEHQLELAYFYAACRVHLGPQNILFSLPQKIDFSNLFPTNHQENHISHSFIDPTIRHGMKYKNFIAADHAQDHANYCINCHNTNKDSCRIGLKQAGEFKINPLGNNLTGCPLDQKISEMNFLQIAGNLIAALAVITLDNPMVAATGNRICNDCEKACIFQKQQPVEVPIIESQILKDVLALPYGFEIYSLLTRWQPLDTINYLPKPYNGFNILVVGQGPAGIATAHYLLNAGCNVTAIEALKIEKLPDELLTEPIKNIESLKNYYDILSPQGFGGVVEYGITERWEKSNLLILRLLLARRENYKLYDSVRLGGNITSGQALEELGFDHIALCGGSGRPHVPVEVGNITAGNIRTASDFLMALQSGGMGKITKRNYGQIEAVSVNNYNTPLFQIRLPALIIGGGLTAVDAATELLCFYPIFTQQFALKYNSISALNDYEKNVAEELLAHHALFEAERTQAKTENRSPNFIPIIQELGGVKICYRRNMEASPAYRLNHHELDYALRQGVEYIEHFIPKEITTDEQGNVAGIIANSNGKKQFYPAKTILLATGTRPLNIYDFEIREQDINRVTIFGDMDPNYTGSVVKALASAKNNYSQILRHCEEHSYPSMRETLSDQAIPSYHHSKITTVTSFPRDDNLFHSYVRKVIYHSDKLLELIIESPLAAANFKPGQFFKLQNYRENGIQAEPVALTCAYSNRLNLPNINIDLEQGLTTNLKDVNPNYLAFYLEIAGSSTKILSRLQPGERISLMGPIGDNYLLPDSQPNITIIAENTRNYGLISYLAALKNSGIIIDYIAYFTEPEVQIKMDIFASLTTNFTIASSQEELVNLLKTKGIKSDYLIMQASIELVKEVTNALKNPPFKIITNINSLMQCMLHGVCGQCIQQIAKPGEALKIIFSCQNQICEINELNLDNINCRLKQNSLIEKTS